MTINGVSYLGSGKRREASETPAEAVSSVDEAGSGVGAIEEGEPGFTETVGAYFRQDSIVGLVGTSMGARVGAAFRSLFNLEPEDEFNLAKELEKVPEEDRQSYYWCASDMDFRSQTEYLERRRADEDILRRSGGVKGFAAGLAALIPDAFVGAGVLPGMAAARTAAKVAKPLLPIAAATVKGLVGGATLGAEYGAVHYAFKPETTISDAVAETVAAGAIGAFLAGGGTSLKSLRQELKETLKCNFPRFSYVKDTEIALDSKGNVNMHAIADLPKWFQWIYALSPVGKCATSSLNKVNKLGEMFFRTDTQTYLTKEGADRYAAAEALIEKYKGTLLEFRENYVDEFAKFLRSDYAIGRKLGKNFFSHKKVNFQFFEEETRLAILRGGVHDIPEIASAAKVCNKYLNLLMSQANELEVLHIENLGGPISQTYLTAKEAALSLKELLSNIAHGKEDVKSVFALCRSYDIPKVIEGREELLPILKSAQTKAMGRAQREKIDAAIDARVTKIQEKIDFSKELAQEKLDHELQQADLLTEASKEKARVRAKNKYDTAIEKLEKLREQSIDYLEAERISRKDAMGDLKRFSEEALNAEVESQYNHIIGAADGRRLSIPNIRVSPTSGGKLDKPRSIFAGDELLSPFLVKSPLEIISAVHHKLVPAIAMKRVLRANGYESLQELAAEIELEYAEKSKIFSAALKKPNANVKKIEADIKKLRDDLKTGREMVRDIPLLMNGLYGAEEVAKHPRIAAAIHALSNLNFARLLGGVTLSSLSDPAILVNTVGVKRTSGAYLREFAYKMGNLKDWTESKVTGKEVPTSPPQKLIKDLRKCGAAIEYTSVRFPDLINNRWYSHSQYNYGRWNALAYGSDWLARKAAYLNLNAVWNDFNKVVAERLFIDKLIRTAIKPQKTLADKQFLAQSRFPSKMQEKLKVEFGKHGEFYDDLAIPNAELWADQELKDVFGAAVVTNSHNTVLIPGVGDVPLMLKGLGGRFLVNYRSFQFAYTNNVLTKFFQEGNHRIATTLVSLGGTTLGKYLKALSRMDPNGVDPEKLAIDVLKDNDVMTWLGNATFSAGSVLLKGLKYGGDAAWRQLGREIPTVGLGVTLLDIGHEALFRKGPWSERGLSNIFSILPFYTTPVVNGIVYTGIRNYVGNSGGKRIKRRR
jgi:hypothetical protein